MAETESLDRNGICSTDVVEWEFLGRGVDGVASQHE
jgi:hypothetical protein